MSYESLSHSKWDCKYHVVFVPKYRKKALYRKIRKILGVKLLWRVGSKDFLPLHVGSHSQPNPRQILSNRLIRFSVPVLNHHTYPVDMVD
jgi:Transposase IS200 like